MLAGIDHIGIARVAKGLAARYGHDGGVGLGAADTVAIRAWRTDRTPLLGVDRSRKLGEAGIDRFIMLLHDARYFKVSGVLGLAAFACADGEAPWLYDTPMSCIKNGQVLRAEHQLFLTNFVWFQVASPLRQAAV